MSYSPFEFNLKPLDMRNRPLSFKFCISIHGKVRWPLSDGDETAVEIQIDDLFSYLVEFWRALLLRQTYPFGLTPMSPSKVQQAAELRWAKEPQEVLDEEVEVLSAFEDAHNLSRAFGGIYELAGFWMIREGDRMVCDAGGRSWRLPFDVVADELSRTGNRIAAHLMSISSDKWGAVVEAWNHRNQVEDVQLVAWSAGIGAEVAQELIERRAIEAPKSFQDAANDDDQLLIAARMAGELPTDQIVRIIEIAKGFGCHQAPTLEEISEVCRDALKGQASRMAPHAQGERVARDLRSYIGREPNDRLDVFEFAQAIGVEVQASNVEPDTFDGLAVAGGSYGPGAFLNTGSRRIKQNGKLAENEGARITLAHELCHLLVDRDHPLSAVEVLRSRMPAGVEARARAFAGELLLPTSAAAFIWQAAGSPLDEEALRKVLRELVERFGVSFSVAAWKVEHGAAYGQERFRLRAALDALVPNR